MFNGRPNLIKSFERVIQSYDDRWMPCVALGFEERTIVTMA